MKRAVTIGTLLAAVAAALLWPSEPDTCTLAEVWAGGYHLVLACGDAPAPVDAEAVVLSSATVPREGRESQVWALDDPGAPWPCACAAGPDCTVDGEPAPPRTSLATWSGADCAPTPCVELAGWPALSPRCR